MFDRIFQYDNSFWRFMGKLGDLLILDLFFMITCIPLVTAGVGLCGVYYVIFKLIEHENDGTFRNFIHSFRQNLFQGILLTVILGLLGLFLWCDILLVLTMTIALSQPLQYLILGLLGFVVFLYLVELLYVFPLQARFYNKLHVTLLNALILGFKHLPRTILMICVDGGLLLLTAASFIYAPQIAVFPLMFALPAGAYCNAWILKGVLRLTPGRGDLPVSDDPAEREAAEER